MADVVDRAAGPPAEKVEKSVTKGRRGGPRPNSGGKRPGSGRKKGIPNKMTADIKAAIVEAFGRKGGADYLMQVADDKPEVFCQLLGKVLPMQVTGSDGG